MCGLCVEGTALALAKAFTDGQAWDPDLEVLMFFDILFAQESQSASLACSRLEPRLQLILSRINQQGVASLEWLDRACLSMVFCRAIDVLVKNGYASEAYQSLLAVPTVFRVLQVVCQSTTVFNERLFVPTSSLQEFLQAGFCFSQLACDNTLNNAGFQAECIAFLSKYIDWWHHGQGMGTKALDGGGDSASDEYAIFEVIYPYVFLSFVVVQTYFPQHDLIGRLVHKAPYFGATPENLDVWLQRQAALRLFDTSGIAAFLPYGAEPRPALIYYLLVKNKLTQTEKQVLRESILSSGEYHPERDWSSAKKYHHIWNATASWIMEELQIT